MSLMKWFRKNKTRLMVGIIFIAIVGFVGSSYLSQLSRVKQSGLNNVVGHYGAGAKIKNVDVAQAGRELEILQSLGAATLLRSINLPMYRSVDLRACLLGELLFSDQRTSPILAEQIKQLVRSNNYRISNQQLNDIYSEPVIKPIMWHLLKTEASNAGIAISNENAGRELGALIPKLIEGAQYSQVIKSVMERFGVDENFILSTFAKMLSVLEYAKVACGGHEMTTSQIMNIANNELESLDAEIVRFNSSLFADPDMTFSEEQIAQQFAKYKDIFSGEYTDENPYGFGYMIEPRVKLEYLAVKLEDVEKTVNLPTQEEIEFFYQKNRERFTEQIPSDANDPNLAPTTRIKTFAEMADLIHDQLLRQKVSAKAILGYSSWTNYTFCQIF